jgi:hypothetical protein
MTSYLKTVWQKLATVNNLEFKTGRFWGQMPQVVGKYRGHTLKLEVLGKIYVTDRFISTRIILSINGSIDLYKNKGVAEKALAKLHSPITSSDFNLKGQIYIGTNSQHLYYIQEGIEDDVTYLQSHFDLLCEIGDSFAAVTAVGGETVSVLQEIASDTNHILQGVAVQLLKGIAQETKDRLSDNASNLICPRCVVHCYPHDVYIFGQYFVTYYGCRLCGQSQEFFKKQQIIVTLDNQMAGEKSTDETVLRVNWLHRRSLFDFDKVEIARATDEDVERFAVQVGNDTDPVREPYYRTMTCIILSECELSQNTIRILQKTFGQVEYYVGLKTIEV